MLDIIVPCYNEEEIIEEFYNRVKEDLKSIKYTIIFVNDGSSDKTLEILKNIYKLDNKCVRIINFSRNFGKESAIYAGLEVSNGKYCSIIDADLQQNPKYLLQMYEYLENHTDCDVVALCQKQKKNRKLRRIFYSVMNKLSNIYIENGASDFRLFRDYVKDSMLKLCEKNRFSKGIFSYVGYNTYYTEYTVEDRKKGTTKWSTKKLFNYAATGITAFSTKPLRFVTYTGIITSLIAFIYLTVLLIKTIALGIDLPGYASIMSVILFIGGFMLIGLGIVGEYIAKIYEETKNRPIYIAKEKIGFDDDIL